MDSLLSALVGAIAVIVSGVCAYKAATHAANIQAAQQRLAGLRSIRTETYARFLQAAQQMMLNPRESTPDFAAIGYAAQIVADLEVAKEINHLRDVIPTSCDDPRGIEKALTQVATIVSAMRREIQALDDEMRDLSRKGGCVARALNSIR